MLEIFSNKRINLQNNNNNKLHLISPRENLLFLFAHKILGNHPSHPADTHRERAHTDLDGLVLARKRKRGQWKQGRKRGSSGGGDRRINGLRASAPDSQESGMKLRLSLLLGLQCNGPHSGISLSLSTCLTFPALIS